MTGSDTRKMNKIFSTLRSQIYGLVIQEFANGVQLSDLLEEDIELCEHFCDKITNALIEGKTRNEVLTILSSGDSIYGHFTFESNKDWANSVIDNVIKLQSDIQKYAKLAAIERKQYPEDELKRRKLVEDELEECLRLAEKDTTNAHK